MLPNRKNKELSFQTKHCRHASHFIQQDDISGTMPRVRVTKDPEEWKAVDRILPMSEVPEPPQHKSYPTPSGWVPQCADTIKMLPYFVKRTRFHNMPINLELRDGGSRVLTQIKHVQGDIWKFEEDLKDYLSGRIKGNVYTQVDELCCKVRVRGNHTQLVADFLLTKGL